MSGLLRNASIRAKVLGLVMSVTTVALLLTLASLLSWDYYQFRTDIGRELATQAQLVLENSTAAMSFQDDEAARETLATLAPNRHIRVGCLYTASGGLFAQYRPDDSAAVCPQGPPAERSRFGPDSVEVVAETTVAGRPAGQMYLLSDLDAVSGRARVQGLTALLVFGLALVVALVLSSALERIISEPIDALVNTARAVSTRTDYSLRAQKTTGDELGVLVDAFNGMLSQIERSEAERALSLVREREANRLKDEFLMTLSHELRTPLNAIQGWTRMLLSRVIRGDGVERALQKIERNTKAQARLVEDLLEVSRYTTGKFRLERLPLDLVTIANQTVETVRPDADLRRIRIECHFAVTAAPMTGDADRLQQVMWNLLSNAVKFSPDDARVALTIDQRPPWWEVRVEDSGIGIDLKFLPFVFDPFRQADASSTRAHSGLGLGLSIARRIVDLHGGEIEAASAGPGLGASFIVRLPMVMTATQGVSPNDRPSLPDGGELAGVHVLVVDDDNDTREILETLLHAAGATVQSASNAADALALATTRRPAIVLSDIAMPAMDGYSLLAQLRTVFDGSMPVTVALTAQATPGDRERAIAAGFDHHVAKPFDPIELLDLLRESIHNGG